MVTSAPTINEFKDAFFSLKINKIGGYDDINLNFIKKYLGNLCKPLKYIFDLSFQKGIFPESLKVAKVTPIFNCGEKANSY